ncbi:MAG TPA: hypothetical protein VNV15_06425 [Opitutaceae bacterium]|nr:hypothetical protein [Opitutaceae bacterium]
MSDILDNIDRNLRDSADNNRRIFEAEGQRLLKLYEEASSIVRREVGRLQFFYEERHYTFFTRTYKGKTEKETPHSIIETGCFEWIVKHGSGEMVFSVRALDDRVAPEEFAGPSYNPRDYSITLSYWSSGWDLEPHGSTSTEIAEELFRRILDGGRCRLLKK